MSNSLTIYLSRSPLEHFPGRWIFDPLGQGGPVNDDVRNFECMFCHENDSEIVRNGRFAFVVICNSCGYAQAASLPQLLAS